MSPKSITLLLAVAVVALVIATDALALPAFTTAPKTSAARGDAAELSNVAVACHDTFDRFVIRAQLATPGYNVRYVPGSSRTRRAGQSRCWAPSASASRSTWPPATTATARTCWRAR